MQQETAKGDLIQKWDKNKRYIYRGCLVMKYKRKCKYCENKEGHILEQYQFVKLSSNISIEKLVKWLQKSDLCNLWSMWRSYRHCRG